MALYGLDAERRQTTNQQPLEHPRAKSGSARGRQVSSRRVRDLIGLSIRLGYISPDDQLVENELIELFHTSRTSVRTALARLSDAGVLDRKRREGTRVTFPGLSIPIGDIRCSPGEIYIEIIEDRVVPMFPLVKDVLRLRGSRVRMVENAFIQDGIPIGIRTAYFSTEFEVLPAELSARVGETPADMARVMEDTFKTRPGRVRIFAGADIADARDARLLDMPEGGALVVREMTYFNDVGHPIQITFDRFRGEQVHLEGEVNL